jgi:hypothetical protein
VALLSDGRPPMPLLAERYWVDDVTMHSYDLSFTWFSSR